MVMPGSSAPFLLLTSTPRARTDIVPLARTSSPIARAVMSDTPSRPQVPSELLISNLDRAHNALQYAYEAGHGRFAVQDGDSSQGAVYFEGLAGCSDQSFNSIVFPLKVVLDTLKACERELENWACRAKKTKSLRGAISMWLLSQDQRLYHDGCEYLQASPVGIGTNEAISDVVRVNTLKGILYDDIGR